MKKLSSLKFLLFIIFYLLIQISVQGQTNKEALISASQAGAMPLYFNVKESSTPILDTGTVNYKEEFIIRTGLPNFFYKARLKDSLRIGFIGGSITRGDNMYRNQTAKYIQSLFPKTPMIGLNAGISGTGSDLGACRVHDQLLVYKPDLVFIEFAVNGANPQGIEGIIRQIRKFDATIDICLIYTISEGQAEQYFSGNMPKSVERLEKIANHYEIPSVHLGLSIGFLQANYSLIWKGNPDNAKDVIVFSKDGLHPTTAGGTLYAAAIARAMNAMKTQKSTSIIKCNIPNPLYEDNWEDAKMLDPKAFAVFDDKWSIIDPIKTKNINEFKPWFPYVIKADQAGASFSFKFKGTVFGIFDIGGPEVGQLVITIDGEKQVCNRFNKYCNNRYRGQYITFKVPDGEHEIKFEIDSKIPDKAEILGENQLIDLQKNKEKYNQSVIYLGKILIKGSSLKSN
ncbi:SGNH/GDSL hydrolase family protein [Pedobacter sp. SD-b]|uniref:SGNH/GDSL hydrolase family protein n=1 Tax=Pedobacter segetis TaxID=2793069 RepID=A0ABS1BLG6_9SPHI|nr:SGNH/GDSL hydrolase family protein [Pedobacter segetis]MBK0383586.1 SGNH/GDSL hydrolase family protein [Pedobacter segetis]